MLFPIILPVTHLLNDWRECALEFQYLIFRVMHIALSTHIVEKDI